MSREPHEPLQFDEPEYDSPSWDMPADWPSEEKLPRDQWNSGGPEKDVHTSFQSRRAMPGRKPRWKRWR